MKAVGFKHQSICFVDKVRPEVAADEVVLRPLMAGICNTDVELLEGYHQFEGTPGHEFVGTVEESPGNPQLEGRRVVSEINCGCGQCSWCEAGNQRHCPDRKVIGIKDWDGAFAEYVKAPLANLHVVD
ncbi:MAG: alcohol dehydrogenase catalytic domain-containing protein, partial [Desulforhabdus sp.]|nr:alcohol dehydrogenase catalytic domain-containing protein [Desulforhabdus sp.]